MTVVNVIREKGYELTSADALKPKKGTVNATKSLANLSRTRSTIFELAACNEWDYFCTFTLDKAKYDRHDLSKFRTDFTQTIRDLRKKYDAVIDYLLIPEQHKDGAWHMHGFIAGLPKDELRKFGVGEKLPDYIRKKIKEDAEIFEWITYRKKFGFCEMEKVKDSDKAASYVTKYITKDLMKSVSELNHKSYYCSQGLNRAIEIKRGHLAECPTFSFENEYCKIKWFDANTSETSITDLFE